MQLGPSGLSPQPRGEGGLSARGITLTVQLQIQHGVEIIPSPRGAPGERVRVRAMVFSTASIRLRPAQPEGIEFICLLYERCHLLWIGTKEPVSNPQYHFQVHGIVQPPIASMLRAVTPQSSPTLHPRSAQCYRCFVRRGDNRKSEHTA